MPSTTATSNLRPTCVSTQPVGSSACLSTDTHSCRRSNGEVVGEALRLLNCPVFSCPFSSVDGRPDISQRKASPLVSWGFCQGKLDARHSGEGPHDGQHHVK